jgi:hypothetical protein
MKNTLIAAAALLTLTTPALSSQLISDEQVGRVLMEVQCGDRTLANAVSYLIHMGVPKAKLLNPNAATIAGYRRAKGWRSC